MEDGHQKVEVPLVHGSSCLYGETRTFSTAFPPDLERTGLITKKEYERIIGKVNSIWSPFTEGVENWVFPKGYGTRLIYIFGSVYLYIIVFSFEESCTSTSRQKRDRKLEETVRYFEKVNAQWQQKQEERARKTSGHNHEGEKEALIPTRGEGRYLRFEMVWNETTYEEYQITTKRDRKIVISFDA